MLGSDTVWDSAADNQLRQRELLGNHITAADLSAVARSAKVDDADNPESKAKLSSVTPFHAKFWAHELTRRAPADSVDRLATALVDAQVDLNPHQVDAALFAFRSPLSKGVLLADEVGLGKTIEAGRNKAADVVRFHEIWSSWTRRIGCATFTSGQHHCEHAEAGLGPCSKAAADGHAAPELAARAFWPGELSGRSGVRRREELPGAVPSADRGSSLSDAESAPEAGVSAHAPAAGYGLHLVHTPPAHGRALLARGVRGPVIQRRVGLPAARQPAGIAGESAVTDDAGAAQAVGFVHVCHRRRSANPGHKAAQEDREENCR